MSGNNQLELLLQKCVNEKIATNGYTDSNFQIESGSEKGDNYLGIITKVVVSAKDGDGKTRTFNWIIKTASENETLRDFVKLRNAYLREMFIYEHVFTEYETLQENLDIEDQFLSYPTFIMSKDSVPESIIMDDLKSIGYIMKNRLESLNFHHADLVMKEYGRLHALSFALRETRPEIFERYKGELKENYFTQMDSDLMVKTNKNKMDQIEAILKDDGVVVLEKFRNFSNSSVKTFLGLLQPDKQDQYSVICHGDSWVNNILFKYEKQSDIPTKLCFLDFQLSRFGSPALDLSYFMYTCTDQKLRDEKFDDLLETYHASLVNFLKKFSLDGEKLFPYNAVHEQMREFSRFGIVMASMVIHLMLSDKDEVPDMSAIKDKSGNEFTYVSKNEDIYLQKMRDVILDGIKRQYIV